jgi:hypothetical protein
MSERPWRLVVLAATAICLAALVAGCSGNREVSGPDRVAAGKQYHVASTGKDTNPGTAARPWKTMQHAADVARAGATVLVHRGTYAEEVHFSRSGTAAAPITFAAAPGEKPVVRALQLDRGASHLRFRGFHVRGYRAWGVTVLGSNQDLVFSRLRVTGGEAGVHFTLGDSGTPPQYGPVSDVVLEDSVIAGTRFTAVDATPGPANRMTFRRLEIYGRVTGEPSFGSDGLAVERGRDLTVEDCYIHDNGGDGIDLNSRDRTGGVGTVVVRRNRVVRNRLQAIKLWAGGRMERNVVWGQGINPILVGVFDCSCTMLNNTVAYNMWSDKFGARDYASVFGMGEPPAGPAKPKVNLTLRGNLWAFNTGPAQGSPTGIYLGPGVKLIEERDNLFFSRADGEIDAAFLRPNGPMFTRAEIRNGTWARRSGHGQGDLAVDPKFVSPWPNVDLHLQPGSPAAGRGAY